MGHKNEHFITDPKLFSSWPWMLQYVLAFVTMEYITYMGQFMTVQIVSIFLWWFGIGFILCMIYGKVN